MADTNYTPSILGNDIIKIAKGTTANTMPTDFSGAIEMQEFVNKMPQFFPDKESLDYKVLASTQSRSILGARGAVDGVITVQYCAATLTAHTQMVAWQLEDSGCFWLLWYITAEDRTVAMRCTVDDKLKTPEDESGGIDTKEIQITNMDEAIQATGNSTGSVIQITAPTASATLGVIAITGATGAVSYEVYKYANETYILKGTVVPLDIGEGASFTVYENGTYYVKAIGDGGEYSNSDYSTAITISTL